MDVPRLGFGATIEWAVAAGCILAVVLVSTGLHDLRDVDAIPPVMAVERSLSDPPASVPPGAVSVPMLVLGTGEALRVGERVSAIADRLHGAWQIGADALERSEEGSRLVRQFDDGARRFAVVLEPAEGEGRVVGIYVK